MDPLTGSAVNAVVSESVKRIDKLIDLARQAKEAELNRVLRFFDAAAMAVQALEQESDSILTEAYTCDLNDPKRLKHLQVRLQTFLHEDNIRPRLRRAIAGLEECHTTMSKEASNALAWPWKKKDRQQAILDFSSSMTSLLDYLNRLDQELGYLPFGTGPRARYLSQIDSLVRQTVDGVAAGSIDAAGLDAMRETIRSVVQEARSDPTKAGWGPFLDGIASTRNHIRRAFKPTFGVPIE